MKIAIHKLADQMGLTSRTLRHWESEGLFQSERNPESGWRSYNDDALYCIRLTALLRKFDIPIKDIKSVLDIRTYGQLCTIIQKRIADLTDERLSNLQQENQMNALLTMLYERNRLPITDSALGDIEAGLESVELDAKFNDAKIPFQSKIKVIVMPAMRAAYNIAIGLSPEDDAMDPVFAWIGASGLSGTARFFGFNAQPWPIGNQPYGFGICASIPENAAIPGHLKEMRMQGGMYATIESSEDISSSWKAFIKGLSDHEFFDMDNARMGFEEHIPIIKSDGINQGFSIVLMAPVKQKN